MIEQRDDIYIMLETVSEKTIELFLTEYLNGAKGTASYYELYNRETGKLIFECESAQEMIFYLAKNPNSPYYQVYLKPKDSEIKMGMVVSMKDDAMLLGLSVYPINTAKYIEHLTKTFYVSNAIVCNETIPPMTISEFNKIAEHLS